MKKAYLPAITSLRAVAAYMVYIVHTDPFSVEKFGQSVFDFFDEFHVGVTIFFVLSGFLITYNYYDEEKLNFKEYFENRFARIYPMYFLLTTATFLFFNLSNINFPFSNFNNYVANLTFLRGFSDTYKHTGLGQGWTLTVEEMFYFMAPLVFVLIKKSKLYLYFLPFLLLLIGFFLVFIFKNVDFLGFMKNYQFMLEFTFFGRCFEFFIGIGLALLIRHKKLSFKYFTYFGIAGMCLSIYLISILKGNTNSGMNTSLGLFINTFVLPIIGIAPLIYGLIFEKTPISLLFQTKIAQLLGKSSYVFYLIHLSFIATFIEEKIHNYILIFLIINVLSILMFLYIEKPLNNFIKNAFKKVI